MQAIYTKALNVSYVKEKQRTSAGPFVNMTEELLMGLFEINENPFKECLNGLTRLSKNLNLIGMVYV